MLSRRSIYQLAAGNVVECQSAPLGLAKLAQPSRRVSPLLHTAALRRFLPENSLPDCLKGFGIPISPIIHWNVSCVSTYSPRQSSFPSKSCGRRTVVSRDGVFHFHSVVAQAPTQQHFTVTSFMHTCISSQSSAQARLPGLRLLLPAFLSCKVLAVKICATPNFTASTVHKSITHSLSIFYLFPSALISNILPSYYLSCFATSDNFVAQSTRSVSKSNCLCLTVVNTPLSAPFIPKHHSNYRPLSVGQTHAFIPLHNAPLHRHLRRHRTFIIVLPHTNQLEL